MEKKVSQPTLDAKLVDGTAKGIEKVAMTPMKWILRAQSRVIEKLSNVLFGRQKPPKNISPPQVP